MHRTFKCMQYIKSCMLYEFCTHIKQTPTIMVNVLVEWYINWIWRTCMRSAQLAKDDDETFMATNDEFGTSIFVSDVTDR